MHDTTEQERLDGLVAQLRADLPGENRATVEKYVRQRVSEVGLNVGDDEIARIVDDLAAD
ncbi:hypothetical protein CBF90_09505 [Microbacterium sp. AISO3]|nr:hypothetical protein CBF90_09505 [Microbacterium sp. AISO3]POX68562.1 hypothetical protein C3481_05865 [Microbacterium sp. Ru50]QCR41863.1 hypothetical protein C1N74_03685 [Microbacterium sp. SGAir0570]